MAVHSSYRPREQRRAAGILAALVLGAILLWAIAMATTGSQTVEPDLFGSAELSGSAPAGDGTGGSSSDAGGAGGGTTTGDDAGAQGRRDGADGPAATAEGDGGSATDAADEEGTDPATEDEADAAEEDEADGAEEDDASQPIEVEGGQAAWVAIVASLSGSEFSEAAARSRLAPGQQLLWSSNYPSLNPGLWVIVEGPFGSEGEARSAARRLGSGAYPRVLTEDEGDRYCALARGCSG